ncbi:uncharacterized protein CC84DRAFT_1159812 [Paraphaeosphaeria sporulosa]|uniref:Uncharacterized protein n=1 Tax=Paraphaeosphaeria sporulosa TaxID=1460663 RepID=A0A177CZW9_9PLEO|nr:uncharacterized protein CC84DRAFT_1159812 [Paraphaeosphaeria sporulosa]OAG12517.1 hypothetical protein CC84DRAFT_1159812 [Paraphaeosphaeria sporulosa]
MSAWRPRASETRAHRNLRARGASVCAPAPENRSRNVSRIYGDIQMMRIDFRTS